MLTEDCVEIPEVTGTLETPTLAPSTFEADGKLNLLHTELNYSILCRSCISLSILTNMTSPLHLITSALAQSSSLRHLETLCIPVFSLPTSTGATPPVESAHTPTPSLLPPSGTDNSPARESSAGAIAGALVGVVLVVVVAVLVVLLVVLVLRRRQKKQLHAVNTEERVLDNPVYAGTLS